MEVIGPLSLLYIMFTLPKELGLGSLPWGNWVMASCFVGGIVHVAIHGLIGCAGHTLSVPRRHLAHLPQP